MVFTSIVFPCPLFLLKSFNINSINVIRAGTRIALYEPEF